MLSISLVVTVFVTFVLLLIGEYLSRRKRKTDPEISRKFVHISVGSFVAFWPLFLTWNQILLMSAAFLAVIVVSQYFRIFKVIRTVQRPTWGIGLFAIIVGLLALVTQDGWIFAAAVLHMSLADGFAAIVGMRYSKKNGRYTVFGHTKSVIGSSTFAAISLLILVGYIIGSGHHLPLAVLLGITAVATLLENVSAYGLDNLTVPLFVAFVLERINTLQ